MLTMLTIAGSDSSGGAGLQADLKTFAAHGAYGASVVTAVTAQNTQGVRLVHALPAPVVAAQLDAVDEDLSIDGVKIGLLTSREVVVMLGRRLARWAVPHVVVDPVMVATSGDPLLPAEALNALRDHLFPHASVVTPNVDEAAALSGVPVTSLRDCQRAAERILAMGPGAVVVKGGHLSGPEAVDVLLDASGFREFRSPRLESRGGGHGTGCTFASALAVNLASGRTLDDSVRHAKHYVTGALRHGLPIGHGHGPLDHFWEQH